MTDIPWMIAAGAFLTSPGFGGLAALGGAWIAAKAVGRSIKSSELTAGSQAADDRAANKARLASEKALAEADAQTRRDLDAQGDRRARFFEIVRWLYENQDTIPTDALLDAIEELEDLAVTDTMRVMLDVLQASALTTPDEPS